MVTIVIIELCSYITLHNIDTELSIKIDNEDIFKINKFSIMDSTLYINIIFPTKQVLLLSTDNAFRFV